MPIAPNFVKAGRYCCVSLQCCLAACGVGLFWDLAVVLLNLF